MGRRSASQGCVAIGNQDASCSRQPRPLGLPLNPLECGRYCCRAVAATSSALGVNTDICCGRSTPTTPPRVVCTVWQLVTTRDTPTAPPRMYRCSLACMVGTSSTYALMASFAHRSTLVTLWEQPETGAGSV